jgi:hypothetical protein
MKTQALLNNLHDFEPSKRLLSTRDLCDYVFRPPDFGEEASPQPFGSYLKVADLIQQLGLCCLVVPDGGHWERLSAFFQTGQKTLRQGCAITNV